MSKLAILVVVVAAVRLPPALAATGDAPPVSAEKEISPIADCEKAAAECKDVCGGAAIYDEDRESYVKASDFRTRCERSCSAGFESCKTQDSRNSCDTFRVHCVGACPWTVVEPRADRPVPHSDAFSQCSTACASGTDDCEAAVAKVPVRKRTGTFDACVEAQGACYAGCMGVTLFDPSKGVAVRRTDFPDLCAEACAKAVPPCKAAGPEQRCDEYSHRCEAMCPRAVSDESDNLLSTTDSGPQCAAVCRSGRDYCKSLSR